MMKNWANRNISLQIHTANQKLQRWKDLWQRGFCENARSLGEAQPPLRAELQETEGFQCEIKDSVCRPLLRSRGFLPQLLRWSGGWCCSPGWRSGRQENIHSFSNKLAYSQLFGFNSLLELPRWTRRPLRSGGSAPATSSPSPSWWSLHSNYGGDFLHSAVW